MAALGSSRIIAVTVTVTGGYGPTGPTGPTGNTGNYATGPIGPNGIGIIGLTYNPTINGVTFQLSNGNNIFVSGIKGDTGAGATANPPGISYVGDGIIPLLNAVGVSGYTLFFRSITFDSGLSGYASANTIFIQNNLGSTGSFDQNKLLYVKYSPSESRYFIDSADFANYKEVSYSGVTYAELEITAKTPRDLLDGNNFNYSVGSTQQADHVGLTMTIDSAFYGMTGTEQSLISSPWYPYLKFRTTYFDSLGSSGATVGTYSFSQLGPFTKQINVSSEIGSCCFECNICPGYPNGRNCIDYVSKAYCESISGRWNVLNCYDRQSTYDCFARRACCVNGRCINTTQLKCEQMRGSYCSSQICGLSYNCDIPCFSPQTFASTAAKIYCCCKDGIGTEISNVNDCIGFAVEGSCSDVNCCNVGNTGACCLPNGSCVYLSAENCMLQNGVYKGTGTMCTPEICCSP